MKKLFILFAPLCLHAMETAAPKLTIDASEVKKIDPTLKICVWFAAPYVAEEYSIAPGTRATFADDKICELHQAAQRIPFPGDQWAQEYGKKNELQVLVGHVDSHTQQGYISDPTLFFVAVPLTKTIRIVVSQEGPESHYCLNYHME